MQDSYERARTILKTRSKEHNLLAEALLQYETLNAVDISKVIKGQMLENRWDDLNHHQELESNHYPNQGEEQGRNIYVG